MAEPLEPERADDLGDRRPLQALSTTRPRQVKRRRQHTRGPSNVFRDEQHLFDAELGVQAAVLERAHEAAPRALLGKLTGEVFAVEADLATRALDLPRDCVEQRGLAGTVRPDETDHCTRCDVERHTVDGMHTAVPDRNVTQLERGRGHVTPPFGAPAPASVGSRSARTSLSSRSPGNFLCST
jgi:hypothetical protein